MAIQQEVIDELKSIKKRIENLIKDLEEIGQPKLFENDEDEHISRFKKSKNPFFARMKEDFLEYFEDKKQIKYGWSAKESVALNRILDKIILNAGLIKKDVLEDPKSHHIFIVDTFRVMLSNLEAADKFTFDNLSLTLFDSRFATIASKIKAQKTNGYSDYENDLKSKINS